jgi:hypothetical protein
LNHRALGLSDLCDYGTAFNSQGFVPHLCTRVCLQALPVVRPYFNSTPGATLPSIPLLALYTNLWPPVRMQTMQSICAWYRTVFSFGIFGSHWDVLCQPVGRSRSPLFAAPLTVPLPILRPPVHTHDPCLTPSLPPHTHAHPHAHIHSPLCFRAGVATPYPEPSANAHTRTLTLTRTYPRAAPPPCWCRYCLVMGPPSPAALPALSTKGGAHCTQAPDLVCDCNITVLCRVVEYSLVNRATYSLG